MQTWRVLKRKSTTKFLDVNESNYAIALVIMVFYRICTLYFSVLFENSARPVYSHLFFYASFLYKNSTSFENITSDNDVIASLILTDKSEFVDDLQCRVRFNIKTQDPNNRMEYDMQNGHTFVETDLPTSATTLVDLDHCRLKTVVLLCHIPPYYKSDYRRITVGNRRSGVIKNGVFKSNYEPLAQLTPKTADKTPRRLVICMSRVFAFEKWQLILLAMEVYRYYKVDLVVTHVNSILEPIFRLMKEYERDYILVVRPGITDLPYWPDQMAYDPNTQTEFSGQLVMNHECFFEFRESSEFIALLDWDDLLVTSTFTTLFETFQHAVMAFPHAALYKVNSIPSTILNNDMNDPSKGLLKLVRDGVLSSRAYREEKLIVRPSKLLGFWMHNSNHKFDGYSEHPLTTQYAFCLHLAKEKINLEDRLDYNEKLLASILNLTEFEAAVRARFKRLLMSNAIDNLPRDNPQPYYYAILECSRKMRLYYKIERQLQCMAYNLCNLPVVDTPCVIAQNTYRQRAIHYNGTINMLVAHQRLGSDFIRRRGCT